MECDVKKSIVAFLFLVACGRTPPNEPPKHQDMDAGTLSDASTTLETESGGPGGSPFDNCQYADCDQHERNGAVDPAPELQMNQMKGR